MDPKEILERTRALITAYANGDPDHWWYANRFVFAGLMWDERHSKAGIQERLLAADSLCHHCGKEFTSGQRVCLHRVDPGRGYSQANCVLMHLACHKQCHAAEWEQARASHAEVAEAPPDDERVEAVPGAGAAEVVPHTEAFAFAPDAEGVEAGPDAEGAEGAEVAPAAEADEIVLDVAAFAFAPDAEDDTVLAGEPVEIASDTEAVDAAPAAEAVLDHKAEPGDGEHFLHQWDITPQVKAELDGYGDVAFIRHDTRMRASVPVETLKGYLTPERQTTRGEGNWGVRILVGHEDELAFEPGPGGGEWVMLPVEWSDQ